MAIGTNLNVVYEQDACARRVDVVARGAAPGKPGDDCIGGTCMVGVGPVWELLVLGLFRSNKVMSKYVSGYWIKDGPVRITATAR